MSGHRAFEFPRSAEVEFPELCIGCLEPDPEDTITFGTAIVGWWSIVTSEFGPRHRVQVPICPRCRRRTVVLTWVRRLLAVVIFGLGIAIALGIGHSLLHDWKWGMKKRLTLVGTACALGFAGTELLDYLLPLPLELTAFTSSMIYKFRNLKYATEFIALNGGIDEDE